MKLKFCFKEKVEKNKPYFERMLQRPFQKDFNILFHEKKSTQLIYR